MIEYYEDCDARLKRLCEDEEEEIDFDYPDLSYYKCPKKITKDTIFFFLVFAEARKYMMERHSKWRVTPKQKNKE